MDSEETVEDLVDANSEAAMIEAEIGERIAGRVALRAARAYARLGQTLTLTDAATDAEFGFIGLIRVLVFEEMAAHFTLSEYSAWARPAYRISVAGAFETTPDGPFVGDTIALPDGTHTVRKVTRRSHGSRIHRTILYVSRDV
ncbi:MAG: hypothetical protein V4671_03865 [Armatimonadota bacterium]